MPHRSSSRSQSGRSGLEDLATGLGWFSIALGIAEVAAPRMLARRLGMRGSEGLIQAYGLREIATGIGILVSRDPTPWVWGRVAGDTLDIATLLPALSHDNPRRENVGMALAAVAGVTVLDAYCAQGLSAEAAPRQVYDYSDRSGFRSSPEAMRGRASAEESDAFSEVPNAPGASGRMAADRVAEVSLSPVG